MQCVTCDENAGHNRAVVDVRTGVHLGGFCHECERTVFGICLVEQLCEETETCLFCDGSGDIALPSHKIEISLVEGDEGVHEGFGVTDSTPHLCEGHAGQLLDAAVIPSGSVEAETPDWSVRSRR